MKIPSRRYTGPNAGGWVHPQSPRRQVNHYRLVYVPGAGWAYSLSNGAAMRLTERSKRYYATRAEAIKAASDLGLPVSPGGEIDAKLIDIDVS